MFQLTHDATHIGKPHPELKSAIQHAADAIEKHGVVIIRSTESDAFGTVSRITYRNGHRHLCVTMPPAWFGDIMS